MADLVDPDPGEPGERVALAGGLGRDALADRADRAPRDPQQLSDRALGALHRQPRRLVLEGAREARSMTRPRHRAHDHAVHWAAHPRRVRLDIGQRRAEIQRPPAPAALAEIEPRTAAPADPAAIQPIKARPGRHDHFSLIAEVDLLDDRGAQPQQPRPYPSSAHVVTASMDSSLREAGTLAARRRAHRLSRSPHPRQQHKRHNWVGQFPRTWTGRGLPANAGVGGMSTSTQSPDAAVSPATIAIAALKPRASATVPAIRPPAT